ncbi:unnamed protein product [Schistocephalus solidus]|uniref:Uncharacterized protein n=1 Tax=Schistocephalus solidus TaxID=70667 RepID=A0A183TT59_SCHSO|nr:unnamed protein product [Schistocephalus solidus]
MDFQDHIVCQRGRQPMPPSARPTAPALLEPDIVPTIPQYTESPRLGGDQLMEHADRLLGSLLNDPLSPY